MKKIIKIILISLVIIGIASVAFYFYNGTDTPKEQVIATTSFEKEIENQVKSQIQGNDYPQASKAFHDIMSTIKTEASIENVDGKKQLTTNEVANCQKIAFYAYAPIFNRYQKSYFSQPSWTDSELNALKAQAQELLSMNIAEGAAKHGIAQVIDNVNDYNAAWAVVRSAHSCYSVAAVKSIKSKVAQYNRAPLTNNASLRAGLNSAYTDAKSSLASNINAICRKVAQNYMAYGSYDNYLAAEEAALNRINEYVNAFGGGSFGNAKNALAQADNDAINYYAKNY